MRQQVTGIIQARMSSSRLPGKVLKKVMGRPLLSYQLERLGCSKKLHEVIVATTTKAEDDPIAELAEQENIRVFRGSEKDVLDRYYWAAKTFNCQHIMRITADCPLIQADLCDAAIEEYFLRGVDNLRDSERMAEGLGFEIFSFSALQNAWQEAVLPSEREHVSRYFVNQPGKFCVAEQEYLSDDSHIRVTVDEFEDFLVVKALLEALYRPGGDCFGINEIRIFLQDNPQIFRLNNHIIRNEGLLKSLEEDGLYQRGDT